jgi:hypothetical protein
MPTHGRRGAVYVRQRTVIFAEPCLNQDGDKDTAIETFDRLFRAAQYIPLLIISAGRSLTCADNSRSQRKEISNDSGSAGRYSFVG